ncbi:MAG: conjugative transfer signal peptidase TraF [Ahrensia sp.]
MSRRRRMGMVVVLFSIPVTLLGGVYGAGLRINWTPSVPVGIWRIAPLNRPVEHGDHVFICPPLNQKFAQARERGYLRRGLCPGWLSPLIKTVVALPGQSVAIGRSIVIDGEELPHSMLQAVDGSGRTLDPFVGGLVPPGFLFLHSPYRWSYDSRYFGPVPAAGLLGLADPVLIFEP